METLSGVSPRGLEINRNYLKAPLRRRVLAVADEETRALAATWATTDFARSVKKYLKTADHVILQ